MEAKNIADQVVPPSPWVLDDLTSLTSPYTCTIDLSAVTLGDIETLTWVVDNAKLNGVVAIDRVRLRVRTPDLSVANVVFLMKPVLA